MDQPALRVLELGPDDVVDPQGELDQASSGHEHVRVISGWFAELERTFSK